MLHDQTEAENEKNASLVTGNNNSLHHHHPHNHHHQIYKSLEIKIEPTSQFNSRLLLQAIISSFEKSQAHLDDHDDVKLKEYLLAYEELAKFLECLGKIFYFVIVDVRDKIGILEKFMQNDPDNYVTILKTVEYEKSINAFSSHSPLHRSSATRTILRLHRALIFICKFIERLFNADNKLKTPQIGLETYEQTLGKHHSWFIRKAVMLGMHALPTRDHLIGYMCPNQEDHDHFPLFISNIEKVYNITQSIYEKYDILELP
jgi:hypothetical protein